MRKNYLGALPQTVDQYIQSLPKPQRVALENLRKIIRSVAPKAEEIMSYGIPTYKLEGALVCFGAYPKHCSFYVINKDILLIYAKELSAYKTSGTTIHFTPELPIPASLVKTIVKLRLERNKERKVKK